MRYSRQTVQKIKDSGIGILATDTIYGVVCQALNEKAVERVYELRGRRPDKPCIILIAEVSNLSLFGIDLTNQSTKQLINRLWPGQVSIVLACDKKEFSYLHRGTKTLAFRLPAAESLRALLRETGPLIAPSANPEGQAHAVTIGKAKLYFEDHVDFYEDAGPLEGGPSTVVEIREGRVVVLRQGAVTIPTDLL